MRSFRPVKGLLAMASSSHSQRNSSFSDARRRLIVLSLSGAFLAHVPDVLAYVVLGDGVLPAFAHEEGTRVLEVRGVGPERVLGKVDGAAAVGEEGGCLFRRSWFPKREAKKAGAASRYPGAASTAADVGLPLADVYTDVQIYSCQRLSAKGWGLFLPDSPHAAAACPSQGGCRLGGRWRRGRRRRGLEPRAA